MIFAVGGGLVTVGEFLQKFVPENLILCVLKEILPVSLVPVVATSVSAALEEIGKKLYFLSSYVINHSVACQR